VVLSTAAKYERHCPAPEHVKREFVQNNRWLGLRQCGSCE
jgi:hypothetical protein